MRPVTQVDRRTLKTWSLLLRCDSLSLTGSEFPAQAFLPSPVLLLFLLLVVEQVQVLVVYLHMRQPRHDALTSQSNVWKLSADIHRPHSPPSLLTSLHFHYLLLNPRP
eukprot:401971-Hanusia_phi.AAC.1